MIKIGNLESLENPSVGDNLLIERGVEAFRFLLDEAAISKIANLTSGAEIRRNMYRGWSLGTKVTDEQWEEIRNGTFRGMFIGDYWKMNNVNWRIADFNYWLGTGDKECTTPHIAIMPDSGLAKAPMNPTATTLGGYISSSIRSNTLNSILENLESLFGEEHILDHREFLVNAVTNGYQTGGLWYDNKIVLPNEMMIFGAYIITPGSTGTLRAERYTTSRLQLPLMALNPSFISRGFYYWLRDATSEKEFAVVSASGFASRSNADNSSEIWVRPVFAIK